jgi:hypothetical protein
MLKDYEEITWGRERESRGRGPLIDILIYDTGNEQSNKPKLIYE